MSTNQSSTTKKSKEIDIIAAVTKVLANFKVLALFAIIAAIIGVIVALETPKQYTASVVLAPEISGGGGLPESLGDLASMMGVDLGGTSGGIDAIYPEIYPDVFASSDFIVELFDVQVKRDGTEEVKSYYDHLAKDGKMAFWNYPMYWIKKLFTPKPTGKPNKAIDKFYLTKTQANICDMIRGLISCTVDKKTSVITISVKDNDKLIAATMADTIQNRLQQYITVYRTKKARQDLEYVQKLYTEAKEQYVKAQQRYGAYADANTDVILESFKAKRNDMENEMQLRYNTYNQCAQQLQLAKAKVQERTPAFTVIQGATVPNKASSTPRSMIVFGWILFGVFLDAIWILFLKDLWQDYKKKN